ncbi:hypothetical protein [Gordonia rhizosphera]|uniref:UDP-N-acetylmuramoyl-tripeptide--D-alanyl-D-alanine ligase n=1 Tax=Gordonia rhizosphera NBRC 16068 TaxID=1108045 RepID=K6WV27_9ACTN|nr:hypothetical protein [Gordonia rhizosphera]GAB90399.1 UDP-N-acetylmuramoyl-tripeptide--D-alanyl-D-alanine ligase [Gordonia rhizosphera NBRC 16068]
MTATPTLMVVDAPVTSDRTRARLRDLVEAGAARRADEPAARTWAIVGELVDQDDRTENERVVEHDLVGRQAVRLAVDKTLCVGNSRAVRALHQGAVMEGSWGDEVRMVQDAPAARALLRSPDDDWQPGPADVVLIAAADPGVTALADLWPVGRAATRTNE